MKFLFVNIYRYLKIRPWLARVIFLVLIGLFVLFATRLRFESDLQAMMPQEKKGQDISSVLFRNKQLDRIICSVSLKDSNNADPDLLIAFTEAFREELIKNDREHLIEKIEAQQDDESIVQLMGLVQNYLPVLLDEKDYLQIDSCLDENYLRNKLQTNYRIFISPGGLALKQLLLSDPLGWSLPAFKKLSRFQMNEDVSMYDGYLINEAGNQLAFFLHPSWPSSQTKKNKGLEPLIAQSAKKVLDSESFAALQFHYFGGPMVASANAVQMQQDTYLTLGITLVLLLILFIGFFRSAFAPLQIMIPVVFGGSFGMAMMYLVKGEVSLMALGASSVILGIAVNYSLHFMSHLRHSPNKEETIAELTHPMTIGSFTTIAAFLSLTFMHAPVLKELGLFTAFNLIGSSICTLIFLPHFIRDKNHQDTPHHNWLDRFFTRKNKYQTYFLLAILLTTCILGFYVKKVRFTEDLMQMNYMSPTMSAHQKIINQRLKVSLNSLFCVSEGKNLDEALQQAGQSEKQLESALQKNEISAYQPIASFLLSKKKIEERQNRWKSYWTTLKKAKLQSQLQRIGTETGFNNKAFDGIVSMLNEEPKAPDSIYQNTFKNLFAGLVLEDSNGVRVISMVKASQAQRTNFIKNFTPGSHQYVTDRQMITSRFVTLIRDDFYNILFYTSFIVFFTILISYGRIEIALISFIPMVLTWICILGLMGLLGIEFNIINIIISTLIFGLGDDYSIFITDGLLEKYKYGKPKLSSIRVSIYLSAMTTIIGLGVLIFAKHPALQSIAFVSVIGILSILLISQNIQPILFHFFIQKRADKKFHPFTLWSFTKTIFAFTYYVTGCVLLTIVGFILTKCIPFAKDRMKYIYHVMICKMMWSLLYIMGNVKKRFENKEDAHFEKPCVLIANHASFLDLLRIISLHPKILLLTNKWVWRSPVFGALVRMADYYPVEEGAAFSVDKLSYWVDRGYSIAVFPEGTRSYDDEVKRFHKGAFYLAQQLKLDILPTIFHGVGYTMRKSDFLLKDGEINVKFLPRITPEDSNYGITYSERARKIGRMFREEFKDYALSREVPAYYREQLIKNYLYKGPVLEWYCRIKSKLEDNYTPIEKWVPQKGQILNLGCGYGFLDYILHWTSNERQITGLDYDEEKIAIANHNFGKGTQLNFIAGDVLDFPKENSYDCILIMDVLHYLMPDKQKQLCESCIQSLNPGGRLIIRDGLTDYEKRHKGTQLSEIMSTKLFGFNKTNNELHFISKEFIETIAAENHLHVQWMDDSKFTSNITVILQK